MAPIGVAILGGGIFAKENHIPAVLGCSKLALKAIFSRSLKSAQETAAVITNSDVKPDLYATDAGAGRSCDDLLRRSDIEAVIIALPIVSQPAYIEAALAAGKHVLAEKPMAKDVATAKRVIEFLHKVQQEKPVTLGIAENVRFTPKFLYAAEQAAKLGAVNHFSFRSMGLMSAENRYYKTPWRTVPEYQGGFLLDSGVHQTAAVRMLLPEESRPATVHAYTALVCDYLPPIDTVTAVIRARSGATGIFQRSAGSTLNFSNYDVGYERGSVCIDGDKVTVRTADGEETSRSFDYTSGVEEEMTVWADGLESGKLDPMFDASHALADIELLEKMFQSGEQNGAPQTYEHQ